MFIPQEIQEATRVATMLHPPKTNHVPLPTVIPPDLPRIYYHTSSEVGKRTLWVVCILMGLSSLAFYVMATRVPVQKRLFHIITALVTTIGFLSYYAMATGDGITPHPYVTERSKHGTVVEIVIRDIYWARYVDWSLTTPLLLLDLCLLAGINGASILVTIVSDVIMILAGLFAAFARHEAQGWGWYAIACVAYLNVVYQIGYKGRHATSARDNKIRAFFGAISLFTLLLWTAYPIVWAVADGARRVNVDGEIIAYAILDVFAKGVFGFWLLLTHENMALTSPTVDGFWSHGISHDGAIRVGLLIFYSLGITDN
ncbi:family A G protein-coupled receptor-like protein [Daldinia caldariorum]|uniref:family A G protein-coupled receptor-like protein n=1 Tax=Daldinia caldariorum TaxID=326644 RepID=UPI00200731EA|nr:family A G protein-coupled receptor-like protein [Daldinia caldariorum]KAI1466010.1 family A G protein-coupled receptor-like protein [Daldinia caldariorum]